MLTDAGSYAGPTCDSKCCYEFTEDVELRDVERTSTSLKGCTTRAAGSVALAEGNTMLFVEVVLDSGDEHYTCELQYTDGVDWRKPGCQILALLGNGNIYGGYKEWLAQRQPFQQAGLVVDGGFVFVYINGSMTHWIRDPWPARPRLLTRVHGLGHVRLICQPVLEPTALGWVGVGGDGHITLCWGSGDELRPLPELFTGGTVTFIVKCRWSNGQGYDLESSKSIQDCVCQLRFPNRNDGGRPGSSEWWHCTGGNLDEYVGKVLPGTFDASTLIPF